MTTTQLNGEEALTQAILTQPVHFATGYPGSPGGGIIDRLQTRHQSSEAHWSSNEKVAVEKAIGVAINGKNALVGVKSVGLNAMLDPLTVVNLTPLTGALVIVVGDDPGGYGSQNDQDSRLLARFLNLPWFEPATPQHGYDLMRMAFKLSAAYGLPVFIRITRSYAQQTGVVKLNNPVPAVEPFQLSTVVQPRFVPGPANAVAKHTELSGRLSALQNQLEHFGLNKHYVSTGRIGMVVGGHLLAKLQQVVTMDELQKHASILFLQSIYPLPLTLIKGFLAGIDQVVILEENTPVIANQLKQIAAQEQLQLSWQVETHPGEMFRWQIAQIVVDLFPGIKINPDYGQPVDEKPAMKSHCGQCRYDEVLDLLDACGRKLNLEFRYYGDPGCLVTVVDRLQGKFAMGGSVATAFGANIANAEAVNIALVGDSGFFHSSLPAIIDAAWQNTDLAIVLLNNQLALTTGGQPHPGINIADGSQRLDYRSILQSCGIGHFFRVNLDQKDEERQVIISSFLQTAGVRLLQLDINLSEL